MQRVPVISADGRSLMPTKPSRARHWLKEGTAKIYPNDLNIFAIQLINEPSGYETQDVVIGIDPGKLFSGVGVQSSKATLLKLHLILPLTGKGLGNLALARSSYLSDLLNYWLVALHLDRHSSHRQIKDYDGGLLSELVEDFDKHACQ